MKTKTLTLALVFIFCSQFSFSNNLNPELEEKNYIEDIAFNTEEIVFNILNNPPFSQILTMEEENYVANISFNTKNIYDSLRSNTFLKNFQLKDEAYINDIPFDTETIFYDQLALQNFNEFENENIIDDIPFDTKKIAMNAILNNNELVFENEEKFIDDIPFDTYLVFIRSFEYYQIIFANISNEMKLLISNYYNEQVEVLTQKMINNLFYNIDNNGFNLLNTNNLKLFQY